LLKNACKIAITKSTAPQTVWQPGSAWIREGKDRGTLAGF